MYDNVLFFSDQTQCLSGKLLTRAVIIDIGIETYNLCTCSSYDLSSFLIMLLAWLCQIKNRSHVDDDMLRNNNVIKNQSCSFQNEIRLINVSTLICITDCLII